MKFFMIMSIVFVFVGCATPEAVNNYYQRINFDDGISRGEATVIAQKMLLDGDVPENVRDKISIVNAHAFYDGNLKAWKVTLPEKDSWRKIDRHFLYVWVDRKTGDIVKIEESFVEWEPTVFYPVYVK